MEIKYFKESSLESLKSNIPGNLERYKGDGLWVQDYFGGEAYYLTSEILRGSLPDLKLPEDGALYDLENTKALYRELRGLTRTQAADERLWAFLAHEKYWSYMRLRWPVEGGPVKDRSKPIAFIRERYFFMSNRDRALVRNGIARLWWYGHASYDTSLQDPFELTALLLDKLDITQSLLERNFSRNDQITRGVLLAVKDWKVLRKAMPEREQFRSAMRHLTRKGGVTILDALNAEEVRAEVFEALEKYAPVFEGVSIA